MCVRQTQPHASAFDIMHLVPLCIHAKLQVHFKGQALLDSAKLAIAISAGNCNLSRQLQSQLVPNLSVVSNTLSGAVYMMIRTWLSHQAWDDAYFLTSTKHAPKYNTQWGWSLRRVMTSMQSWKWRSTTWHNTWIKAFKGVCQASSITCSLVILKCVVGKQGDTAVQVQSSSAAKRCPIGCILVEGVGSEVGLCHSACTNCAYVCTSPFGSPEGTKEVDATGFLWWLGAQVLHQLHV